MTPATVPMRLKASFNSGCCAASVLAHMPPVGHCSLPVPHGLMPCQRGAIPARRDRPAAGLHRQPVPATLTTPPAVPAFRKLDAVAVLTARLLPAPRIKPGERPAASTGRSSPAERGVAAARARVAAYATDWSAGAGGSGRLAIQRSKRKARSQVWLLPYRIAMNKMRAMVRGTMTSAAASRVPAGGGPWLPTWCRWLRLARRPPWTESLAGPWSSCVSPPRGAGPGRLAPRR